MNLRDYDPASLWNTPGTPPNFGQMPVPHIFTMAGRFSLVSKAYLNADEALLHDSQNAERMRVDCGIMESLEARQRAVALLNWHIEPEDSKSFQQKELAEQLTAILQRTPRFLEMRRNLLEATWYGRYGIALQYSSQIIGGHRRIAARRWEPRHGDKLIFRYNDGTFVTDPEEVGIRVGIASSFPPKLIGGRRKIEPTKIGSSGSHPANAKRMRSTSSSLKMPITIILVLPVESTVSVCGIFVFPRYSMVTSGSAKSLFPMPPD